MSVCKINSKQSTSTNEVCCATNEVCCATNEVCCATNEVCCATNEVCCATNEVCCATNEVCCATNEVCCATEDLSDNLFKILIDGLIEKANTQVETAKSKLRTLVDLNPIKFGTNTISFGQGKKTNNTKTSFTTNDFNITCFKDKVVVVRDIVIQHMPMLNPYIIYADKNYVVVISEIDDECCMGSVISARSRDKTRASGQKFDSLDIPIDNPKTSPVVHQFVDGMVRSMSYDANVLAGAAPRFIEGLVFRATPACVSGSLICDSQYSYIAGHNHVYSRFYNPFTGKCLMFDQSGVTHEYGSVFTKNGIHVEVDSSYLY